MLLLPPNIESGEGNRRDLEACFGNIHSGAGGRIFVIDPGSVAATMRTGQLQLREISLTSRLARGEAVHSIWISAMVGTNVVMMPPPQRRAEGLALPRVMDTAAQKASGGPLQRIHDNAARGLPSKAVVAEWRATASNVEGDRYDRAAGEGLGAVLAFLQQVESCCMDLTVETDQAMLLELRRRVDIVLGQPGWAPLMKLVLRIVPGMDDAQLEQLHRATAKRRQFNDDLVACSTPG